MWKVALPAGSDAVMAPCRVQKEHWQARTCNASGA
jgi:hypothetical protein